MVETFFAIGVVLLVGAVRWALDRAGSDAATRSWQRHDAFYADPQNRKLTKRAKPSPDAARGLKLFLFAAGVAVLVSLLRFC